MVLSATADAPTTDSAEADEDYKTIIDEEHLTVVRRNGIYAAEIHSPVDLSDLGYRLASAGYVIEELIAFHDGVMEALLRPLGEIAVDAPEHERKLMTEVHEYVKEREKVYA
jgi:hypothetical protein